MRSTKKLILILFLLVLMFSITGCLKSNEAKVKETVNTFFNGITSEEKNKVMNVLDITLPNRDSYPVMLETYFGLNETVSMIINFTDIVIMDNAASVSGNTQEDYYWNGSRNLSQIPFNFTLIKRGSKWLISQENYLIPIFM